MPYDSYGAYIHGHWLTVEAYDGTLESPAERTYLCGACRTELAFWQAGAGGSLDIAADPEDLLAEHVRDIEGDTDDE